MTKFKEPKLIHLILMILVLMVSTQLMGEYVVSREVNGWIQLITITIWLIIFGQTFLMGWRIIKNKFQ
jgi:hypothetical protein